jgi:two-component system response regulator AtoC
LTPGPATTAGRSVLVVDEDDEVRHLLAVLLARAGYAVTAVSSTAQAAAELERRPAELVLVDEPGPAGDGAGRFAELRRRAGDAVLIVMSGAATADAAATWIQRGAGDVVWKPLRPDDVVAALRKAEERRRLAENVPRRAAASRAAPPEPGLVFAPGTGSPIEELLRTVRRIAEFKTTVLLGGESGTGKELVARAIHAASPRAAGPFVAVNCGAIPENLLESELFGHKKGAFTDAVRDKPGLFDEAEGGTLLLDEIGELPLQLQVKLLRVLQQEEVRPVGGSVDRKIDVRIIAATVRDLSSDVRAGRFRDDLFYRLNVVSVTLPPLRDRRGDLPSLIEHFVARINARLGTRIAGVTPEAMNLLLLHRWPGNVRELENTVERAMVLAEGDRIDAGCLPERLRQAIATPPPMSGLPELSIKKTVRAVEEDLIRRALQKTHGNRTNAAKVLEISQRTLLYKIKEYGIGEPEN